jgi:HEXXH motif-containing protein
MASPDQLQVQGFSGGSNLALTRKLLRSCQELSALRLLCLADHWRKANQYRAILFLADELRDASASGFWRVWGTPAAHLWMRLAWELAMPPGRRSSLLSKHAGWLGRTIEEFAQEHLPQLGVFTMALHLAAGTSYRTSQAIPVGPLGSFPGAGVAWCSGVPFTLLGCTAAGEILVQGKCGDRACEISCQPCERSPFFRVPEARGRGVMYVDCWDTCSRMDYDGMEWTPREADYSRVRDASTRLSHALQVIEGYSSEISEEVAAVISLAVPLRVLSDAATPSGSVSFLPGLVYFCTF